jgi:S1-C subfamily serine protease
MLRTFSIATSPWSDMELVPMTEALGRYFGTAEGLLVVRGPASDAIDIGDGDVILSINGRTPSSPEHALRILGSYEPGETIEFSIMRDRQRLPIEYLVPTDSRLGTPAGTLWRAP